MNEQDIIKHFIVQQQADTVAHGIGDDCAVLNVSADQQLVTTTDTLVEGRHFVKQAPARELGYKLMATNLSDMAATGATPKWATLNLTLTEFNPAWVSEFAEGLLQCAQAHHVALVGGDTTVGEQLNMSLQLMGEIPYDGARLRQHACVDDVIYVSGTIGCAAQALNALKQHNNQHSALSTQQVSALYRPPSRVALAIAMRALIHASIDISDGLLHELEIICHQSQLGADIQLENIPLAAGMSVLPSITTGDDYELLFTAKQMHTDALTQLAEQYGCPLTAIGSITNTKNIRLYKGKQAVQMPQATGYDHFQ